MENKEHIDRLYQEKFKDFEVTPHPKVWENIEATLQKKKRRVLPFWWISGGAVATLLIGLLLFPFFNEEQPNKPMLDKVIITESEEKPSINTVKELLDEKQDNLQKTDAIIEVVITNPPTQKTIEKPLKKQTEKPNFSYDKIAVVTEKNTREDEKKPSSNDTDLSNNKNVETKIAEQATQKDTKEIKTKSIVKKTKELVALNDTKEEKFKEETKVKWSVTPSVAFLNSGSFNQSSPLGANLNNNPISGENTNSYGVKVGYKINEKWEIQSGIHLQEVQFSTQNVTLTSSTESPSFNINFIGSETLYFSPDSNGTSSSGGSDVIATDAKINQSFGYIEVPIEVKYMLFKKSKFSTQLVTGVSSLFLNKNEIGASSTNFSGLLGEANNLNSVNFSGNLGIDINYQLSQKLKLNVNPMFKQQLNTFSKNANGFKPYSIGVYTGLKYEF